MPIRGDRLRWPPRPGKKSTETSGTRRVLSTDDVNLMRRPDERDQSAQHHTDAPRVTQVDDGIARGQPSRDRGNQASEVAADQSSQRGQAESKR